MRRSQATGRMLALLMVLALLLGMLAGCKVDSDAGGETPVAGRAAAEPTAAKKTVAATAEPTTEPTTEPTMTLAPEVAQSGPLAFDTDGSAWTDEGGIYTSEGEDEAFAWSEEIVDGPFTLNATVESDWLGSGEAMIVVYGDGEGWSPGCLIFDIGGYGQGICANSLDEPEVEWLVQNEDLLMVADSCLMTVRVTEDEAFLFVDHRLAARAPLGSDINREGYIGLFSRGNGEPITYSEVVLQDAADMAAEIAHLTAIAPTPTLTPTSTPTVTPGPSPTPTATPEPTSTPLPPYRPNTGMLEDKAPGGYGELLIQNGTDSDALVILTGMDEVAVKTAYIRAAESFNMTGIADGTYLLFYSKGDYFSAETYRFTQNASYQRMDTTIPFETTSTQYTAWRLRCTAWWAARWAPIGWIRRTFPKERGRH